jgi:hypothetical protein
MMRSLMAGGEYMNSEEAWCHPFVNDRQSVPNRHQSQLPAVPAAAPKAALGRWPEIRLGISDNQRSCLGQHPCELSQAKRRILPMPQRQRRRHDVECSGPEGQPLGHRTHKHAARRGTAPSRHFEHLQARIEADHERIPLRGNLQEPSGSTPDVQHPECSRRVLPQLLHDRAMNRLIQQGLKSAVVISGCPSRKRRPSTQHRTRPAKQPNDVPLAGHWMRPTGAGHSDSRRRLTNSVVTSRSA